MSLINASRLLSAAAEACRGLPHAHQVLFFAIAGKWDPETETSGIKCRHSYQSLRERLEVASTQGRATNRYTKAQIRRYLATLDARGLIKWEGELVFKVPCLAQEKSVQNYEVTREVTREVTPPQPETRTNSRLNGASHHFSDHEGGPFCGHTSDTDDDDYSGAVTHLTEYSQGGSDGLPFAAFFRSQGFTRRQITDAAPTLRAWSARGVTPELVERVVALVNDRLRSKGNEKPWSPKYYDPEIQRRLSSAATKQTDTGVRADAGAGTSGGDEIDDALGGSLH